MKILMVTNLYTPLVGGISHSVKAFTHAYRKRGHEAVVVAPHYDGEDPDEPDVVRFPAIQRALHDRYALPVMFPGAALSYLNEIKADLVHTHHPFLLGAAAQSHAILQNVPLVYTHHTLYRPTIESLGVLPKPAIDIFLRMMIRYCNLCDAVVCPSSAIKKLLIDQGVTTELEIIPTGVTFDRFNQGDGARFRKKRGIPENAFVAGTVSRIEKEKNVLELADALARLLRRENAWCVFVGKGTLEREVRNRFPEQVRNRLVLTGELKGQELVDAYHGFDAFVFASQNETQGMVITEAMAAGKPVVAVSSNGINDVLIDGENGRLLSRHDPEAFAAAISWIADRGEMDRNRLRENALETARRFSLENSVDAMLSLYAKVVDRHDPTSKGTLEKAIGLIQHEIQQIGDLIASASESVQASLGIMPESEV